jgi:trimethylamine--corrinoid protein Co-methyltransferase
MTSKIKSITNPRLKLSILSREDIERIHTSTLDIIETVGVRFPSEKVLKLWEAYGASVNRDTMVVKIPGHIVEDAIKNAPTIYTLAARKPEQDLPLDGNHVFLGTDGCGVEVIDLTTGKRRRSCLQDVSEIARIADFTEQVAFHWVAVSAQDYPPETRSLYELKAIWENSTKHVQTESVYSEAEALAAVEMAAVIAGSRATLRERPILSAVQCTLSPLAQDGGCLEAALVFAEAGIPIGFMTMASCVSNAPATLAGNLVVGNAEVISALALIQLVYPGAKVYYAAAQTAMDLRTGAYTGGGPEDFLFGAASNLIADYYNIPLSMGSFATGAKEPNWQAGIDNSLSTFMASISTSDMLLGVGLLHGSLIWSYAQMLMDCEIFDIIHKMMAGIIIDEENLALDTIRSVGPGGNFLTQKHTIKHMRELWVPKYMDRRPYNIWEEKQDEAQDWATTEARRIMSTHNPEPLPQAISNELQQIILKVKPKK